jgi:hypothetical protein
MRKHRRRSDRSGGARLDRLGPARQVAQIGSEVGREFSYPLLCAVSRLPEGRVANSARPPRRCSGLSQYPAPSGRPGTFTLLAGIFLTDQTRTWGTCGFGRDRIEWRRGTTTPAARISMG